MPRVRLAFIPFATLLLVAVSVQALPGEAPRQVAEVFAARLAAALGGDLVAWESLWEPGARDSTHRMLDLRTSAMFQWSGLEVRVEGVREIPGRSDRLDAELLVRGRAVWEGRAYGVAHALWVLQLDEREESNPIVRREAWRLAPGPSGWRARERILLSPVEIVHARIEAGVYPGQDALLLRCGYRVRSLAGGVRTVRFFLDRRATIYDLRVEGEAVPCVRGGELGSIGLEGFSPEVESSFAFPHPLAAGEEARVVFRILAPLAHLRGEGFVTTLPFRSGPFRFRAWYPIFDAPSLASRAPPGENATLLLRVPKGAFGEIALAGRLLPGPASAAASPLERTSEGQGEAAAVAAILEAARLEEEIFVSVGGVRDVDFLLGEPGRALARIDWETIRRNYREGGAGEPPSLVAQPGDARLFVLAAPDERGPASGEVPLDGHVRARRNFVDPLLEASTYSTRDLASELQDLLPLDLDALDELEDESTTDADQGAAEPARD